MFELKICQGNQHIRKGLREQISDALGPESHFPSSLATWTKTKMFAFSKYGAPDVPGTLNNQF